MRNHLRRLRRDARGVAAIEFALLLPMLLALLIGCLEVTFKIWSTQKAEKLAVTLSDVIAQSTAVTASDLTKLMGAVNKIMDPFPFEEEKGKVIISSVYWQQDDDAPKVNWQCEDGDYDASSEFGVKNADATLPAGFTLSKKDNIIVAEVFYEYEPIAPGFLFDKAPIYRRAMFKPRLGLLTADPGCV